MRISFILPALIKIPIGGVKVIYRHAAELAKLGHEVTIVSPKTEGYGLRYLMKEGAVRVRDWWHGVKDCPYYETPPGVDHHIIPAPTPKFIPDGDVIIATGWQTAYWTDRMPPEKGRKFYFIQNLETYQGNEDVILNTWKLPLTKIVIAQWLKDYARKLGETAYGPVPNAIDPDEFHLENPIDARPEAIVMLYHRFPIKGCADGIKALKKVKESHAKLTGTIFAARKPRVSLPKWIHLEIRPDSKRLSEIYNSSSIFLHPSHQEGWPLPPAEAMSCGCAVVAAENKGIKEYIADKECGLLSSVGNAELLAKNTQYLLEHPEERFRMAQAGRKTILKYSWDRSAKQLHHILKAEV